MKLETPSFGVLDYQEKAIIHIQEGMLGFSHCKRYLLIENEEILPFKWLQCIDDQYVSFPVIDPHIVLRDYTSAITLEDLHNLEIEQECDVLMLVVAVIPHDPSKATVNLRAPLLINHRRMIGKQVILTNSSYHTHQPLCSN